MRQTRIVTTPTGDLFTEQIPCLASNPLGTAIVLHGLGGCSNLMDNETAAAITTHNVIRYDARGHGRTVRPSHFTLAEHVSDLWVVADAWGIERFTLIGYSVGSYTAQEAAIAQPGRINQLILAATRTHGETSSTARVLRSNPDILRRADTSNVTEIVASLTVSPTTAIETLQRVIHENADPHRP